MKIIARIRTDFSDKFGIPRQSGLVPSLRGKIVFEPPYRSPDALRGLEGFSHLWLIWEFSQAKRDSWSPTVRPPRLGGNARVGVFATRSPFRPNPIGLSCVKIEGIELDGPEGPEITVSGADMLNGTPIYDIKPYLPYADSHPEARDGFAGEKRDYGLRVRCPDALLSQIPAPHRKTVLALLAQDPRPSYQNDPDRVYGMAYAGMDVRFRVDEQELQVVEIKRSPSSGEK